MVRICRIQSKCGKIRTIKTPNRDTFYTVTNLSIYRLTQFIDLKSFNEKLKTIEVNDTNTEKNGCKRGLSIQRKNDFINNALEDKLKNVKVLLDQNSYSCQKLTFNRIPPREIANKKPTF